MKRRHWFFSLPFVSLFVPRAKATFQNFTPRPEDGSINVSPPDIRQVGDKSCLRGMICRYNPGRSATVSFIESQKFTTGDKLAYRTELNAYYAALADVLHSMQSPNDYEFGRFEFKDGKVTPVYGKSYYLRPNGTKEDASGREIA